MGQGAVKVKGASCGSSSPVQALFGDVMGQQWLPESSLSEITLILGTGSGVQLF